MNTCDEHGGVMVYDGRDCPVCEEISDLKSTIENLKDKVDMLEEEAGDE